MRIAGLTIERDEADIAKGLLAGLMAGFLATWAKAKMQAKLSQLEKAEQPPKQEADNSDGEEKPSTVKAAEAVSSKVFKHALSDKERKLAGPAVDYGFGTIMGGVYGAAAENMPGLEAGGGLLFGAGVWLFADELGVPAAGLAKWPNKYPAKTHVSGLVGHLVYGFTLELLRKMIRKSL